MPALAGLRKATKPGVPAGRQAAVKTGFPKAGLQRQARQQAGQVRTIVSLRPGFTAERIESSPQRALLLREKFGAKLGGLLEASPDRFNLIRERLTREARPRPKRRRVVAGKRK